MTSVVALVTGVVIGSVTGGVLGLWLSRRPRSRARILDELKLDPDVDEWITAASKQSAAEQGRPEAAGLIAKKARLLYVLNRRQKGYGGWSW